MSRWVVTAATLGLLALGCAQYDTGSVVRLRASEILECPEETLEITQLGAYRYRAEGCGDEVELACTAAALEPRCLMQTDLARAEDPDEAEPEDAPELDEEPPAEIEEHIRAGLQARREDILACTGRGRVGVRVAYAPDGSVDLRLQGQLEDTPEERCVQDALDGVRVAATGRAGVIVHLVR